MAGRVGAMLVVLVGVIAGCGHHAADADASRSDAGTGSGMDAGPMDAARPDAPRGDTGPRGDASVEHDTGPAACGDGVCSDPETCHACPEDCGMCTAMCGN